MSKSTKRSKADWQKEIMHLIDYINASKTNSKASVCRAVVLTTLLYSLGHLLSPPEILWAFHQCCIFKIINTHWSNFISIEAQKQLQVTRIEVMLLKMQLQWVGDNFRKKDWHMLKIVLYSELFTRYLNSGMPPKRYKDYMK